MVSDTASQSGPITLRDGVLPAVVGVMFLPPHPRHQRHLLSPPVTVTSASTGQNPMTEAAILPDIKFATVLLAPDPTMHTRMSTPPTKTLANNISNGTRYYVKVRVYNPTYFSSDNGWGSYSSCSSATPQALVSAPSAPSLSAGDGSIAVSWNKPSNGGSTITRYRVRYGTTCSGSSNVYTTGANSTSTTLSSGISNGTRYYVKVQARNSKGYGLYSSCFSATPQASASKPSAPSAPSLSAGDGSIAVSWNKPSNGGSTITRYRVRYGTTCSGSSNVYTTGANSTSTTLSSGISNGTRYYVKVQARNSKGYGLYSSCFSATPQASASKPSAPSAPSLSAGDGSIAVSWNKPSNGGSTITRYRVRCGTTCSGSSNVYTYSANSTSKTLSSGISNGTRYYVKVQARNSQGYGPYSSCSSATPQASVSAPSAPSVPSLNPGNGSIVVSWGAPGDNGAAISDYRVAYGTACSAGSSTVTTGDGTVTSKTLTSGIANGTVYYVKVQARNSQGWGSYSVCASATPSGAVDSPALKAVYNSTGGDAWTNNTNWNDTSLPLKDWHGVNTDSRSRVNYINLNDNNLTGVVPEQIGDLANLVTLWLGKNKLTEIHTDISQATSLNTLGLTDNNLTAIPATIGQLPVLVNLYLKSNNLTTIPATIGAPSENQIEKPSNHTLEKLNLADNKLTSIPDNIGNLANLTLLRLDDNPTLNTPLPDTFTGLVKLKTLNTTNTNLCIPAKLKNWTSNNTNWYTHLHTNNNLPYCTAPTAPTAPTIATTNTAGELTVTWNPPTNTGTPDTITGYDLQHRTGTTGTWDHPHRHLDHHTNPHRPRRPHHHRPPNTHTRPQRLHPQPLVAHHHPRRQTHNPHSPHPHPTQHHHHRTMDHPPQRRRRHHPIQNPHRNHLQHRNHHHNHQHQHHHH